MASALRDPRGSRGDSREALAVLACAQTLIGHLSTLGAHRAALDARDDNGRLAEAVTYVADSLEEAGHALIRGEPMPVDSDHEAALRARLAAWPADDDGTPRLLAMQLRLLIDEVSVLRRIGQALVR